MATLIAAKSTPTQRHTALAAVLHALCSTQGLALTPRSAAQAQMHALEGYDAFAKGTIDGTAVSEHGTVVYGTSLQRTAQQGLKGALSLCVLPGEALAIGTAEPAQVMVWQEGRLRPLARFDALAVTSIVAEPGGALLVSTLPDGEVHRVAPDGQSTRLARLGGGTSIWALGREASGTLLAATGPKGLVYRIDASGRARVAFRSQTDHVLTLVRHPGTGWLAGTMGPGRVLHLGGDPQGRPLRKATGRTNKGGDERSIRVLHEYPKGEVNALLADKASLYAAVNRFDHKATPTSNKALAPAAIHTLPNQSDAEEAGTAELWRLDVRGGGVMRLLRKKKAFFSSLAATNGKAVLVAEGARGRVLSVAQDTPHLAHDLEESLVVGIASNPLRIVTQGAIYRAQRLGRRSRSSHTWTSPVLDARFAARYGAVLWRSRGRVKLQARTGSTVKPDAFWSAWSAIKKAPFLPAGAPARYLQLRAHLEAETAELYGVKAYYRTTNQSPRVISLNIQRSGTAAKKKGAQAETSDKPPSTEYRIAWKARSPDEDALRYRLHFRAEEQRRWRKLLKKEPFISGSSWSWDTRGIPDGTYLVRLEVSDEESRPRGEALRSTRVSKPVLVDNHAPQVRLRHTRGELRGEAIDSVSTIRSLHYALDSGPWMALGPTDGILDSRKEAFALPADIASQKSSIVAVRAVDESGHSQVAEVSLER